MRRVQCPQCQRALNVPDHAEGKTVRCPGCKNTFPVVRPKADADDREERRAAIREENPVAKPAARRVERRQEADEDDREERRPRRSVRAYDEDEDDRPRRKKRRREQDFALVGLIALLVCVPSGLILFVGSFFTPVLANAGMVLGFLVAVVATIAFFVIVHINGIGYLQEYWNSVPFVLRGGGAFLVYQIKFAIERPRMLASWVAIEFLGVCLGIACAVVHGAVHAGHDTAVASSSSGTTAQNPGPGPGPAPVDPGPPKVTGDTTLDKALVDLEKGDSMAAQTAADKLTRTAPNPQHRALIAQKLATRINDTSAGTRRSVVVALGVWGTADEVPALVNTIRNDDDLFVRKTALEVIGKFKDERALKAISEAFKDGRTRGEAVKAFRDMGPMAEKEVLVLLESFAAPEKVFDRVELINVLKDIGTQLSLPALRKEIQLDNVHTKSWAEAAVKAINARKP